MRIVYGRNRALAACTTTQGKAVQGGRARPCPCPPPDHPGYRVGWGLLARNLRPQEPGLGVDSVGSTRETIQYQPGTAWRPPCPGPGSHICCVIPGKPQPQPQRGPREVPRELRLAQSWELGIPGLGSSQYSLAKVGGDTPS